MVRSVKNKFAYFVNKTKKQHTKQLIEGQPKTKIKKFPLVELNALDYYFSNEKISDTFYLKYHNSTTDHCKKAIDLNMGIFVQHQLYWPFDDLL